MEVLLTKLRESRLGIATYMMGQLKWSCLDRIPELGEVKLIRRLWCRSPHMVVGVVTSPVTRSREGGNIMAVLLWAPLGCTFTRPVENSRPKHKNKSLRERPPPGTSTIG